MNTETQRFVSELPSVEPDEASLYDFVDRFEEIEVQHVVAPILEYMERFCDKDLGSPGPLVHLVERRAPDYIEKLMESIERKPTDLTVWMLNRILNANMADQLRKQLIELMEFASTHPRANDVAKQEALAFLIYQNEKSLG